MLWTPQTGGANIPALNKLLGRFGAAFSDRVFGGSIQWDVGGDAAAAAQAAAADGAADPGASDNVKGSKFSYASGSSLAKFPADGLVLTATLKDELLFEINNVNKRSDNVPILGLAQTGESSASGRLVAFGDSACIDSSQIRGGKTCFWLLSLMLDYANRNLLDNTFYKLGRPFTTLSSSSLGSFSDSDEANGSSAGAGAGAPDVGRRRSELGEYEFAQLSKVFGRSLPQCATVEQEAAELQMSSATAYVDGDAVVFWKEDQYRGAGGVHWPLPSLPLGYKKKYSTAICVSQNNFILAQPFESRDYCCLVNPHNICNHDRPHLRGSLGSHVAAPTAVISAAFFPHRKWHKISYLHEEHSSRLIEYEWLFVNHKCTLASRAVDREGKIKTKKYCFSEDENCCYQRCCSGCWNH